MSRESASVPVLPDGFSDQLVVAGLQKPVSMAFLPDGRLVTVEQYSSNVRLVIQGATVADTILRVPNTRKSPEQGSLGIAIDPGWPTRPYFYVQYNYSLSPHIRISRFTINGDLEFTGDGHLMGDTLSRYDLITDLPDNRAIHNGGTLRFGPDGMLYSSVGDDLSDCVAQDTTILLGKILRLDVSRLPAGPGGPPARSLITPADNPFVTHPNERARLVWQLGLRNPFSFHIDPPTGDLIIADVGAGEWEEMDLATAPGQNFGWPMFEGPAARLNCANAGPMLVSPIYAYDRTAFLQGAAVISGGLYRRPASGVHRFPAEYDGDIFLTDVGEGFLRRLKREGDTWNIAPVAPGQANPNDWGLDYDGVTDFAMAVDGSLWYVKYAEEFDDNSGAIRRIVYSDPSTAVAQSGADDVVLAAPHPSPTPGSVTISYTLRRAARVGLGIYDVRGRLVRSVLEPSAQSPGLHPVSWDGTGVDGRAVPPGVYFVRLTVDGEEHARRVPVIR